MANGRRAKSKKKAKKRAQDRDTIRDQALGLVDGSDFRLLWRQAGAPLHATTGRAFRGINVSLIASRAFSIGVSGGGWMTPTSSQTRGVRTTYVRWLASVPVTILAVVEAVDVEAGRRAQSTSLRTRDVASIAVVV